MIEPTQKLHLGLVVAGFLYVVLILFLYTSNKRTLNNKYDSFGAVFKEHNRDMTIILVLFAGIFFAIERL